MAEKKTILTLNLGSQRIGMARFSLGTKGTLMLRDYSFEEIPGDISSDSVRKSLTTAAVKTLAGRFKAAGADVNFSLPSHGTITRFVKVPSLGEDQVDKIVGFEAQQAVPFPLSETVWDYQVIGKVGGEVEVVIAAIRAEQLEYLNACVTASDLSTKIVDAGPIALYNAFRYNYGEPAQPTLLLDIGSRMTDAIFMDGDRIFVASFPFAGSNISAAIAKEMEADFAHAEDRKKVDGFVHLGGNYADHEDSEIDAMSKIIRNQLTRVHSEINRRIQQFKTQGGSPPTNVYLSGGAAALPYLKEFLEEKMRIPVEWFNALKNVSVGPRVDVDSVSREAHCLGEHVGLALREMRCPMELDLAPRSVGLARSIRSKKPMLLVASLALFAGLGALYASFVAKTSAASEKLAQVTGRFDELDVFAKKLRAEETRQKREDARLGFLQKATTMRHYWLNMINLINSKVDKDDIWITTFSLVNSQGAEITAPLTGTPELMPESFRPPGAASATPPISNAPAQPIKVDTLVIHGLFKVNKVKELFEILKGEPLFKIPTDYDKDDLDKWLTADTGKESTEWASKFRMRLPLADPFELPATTK